MLLQPGAAGIKCVIAKPLHNTNMQLLSQRLILLNSLKPHYYK